MPPTLALLIPILLTLAGCDLLRQDPPDAPLEPGRRDYVWKVDTLRGQWISAIWGSSPIDVWAVAGGGPNELWHYDGSEWTPWPNPPNAGFYAVFGFAQDNVWLGGNDGTIYHFDGTSWSLNFQYKKPGMRIVDAVDIWGTSPSDVYATGYAIYPDRQPLGFLLHYNGKAWREVFITDFEVQMLRVRKDSRGVFISAMKPSYGVAAPDTLPVYRLEGNRPVEIVMKLTSHDWAWIPMERIGKQNVFVIDNTLQLFSNSGFDLYPGFQPDDIIIGIHGRHDKDLFITTSTGVMHYNGEDTQYLIQYIPNAVAFRGQILENDVFFLVADYPAGVNIIHHGKLEN